MSVVIRKLKIREKRDRGLQELIKSTAPAIKLWYNKSVIQFLKKYENEITEEKETLILRLSDYLEEKLDE